MKWLRSKPMDINELDESRIWHEIHGGNVDGDPDEQPPEEEGDENGDVVMASQPTKSKRSSGKTKQRRRTGGDGVGVEGNGG